MYFALQSSGLLIAVAALLGLVVGSFLNVVIYRLPKIMDQRWKVECREYLDLPAEPKDSDSLEQNYSIAWPASHCPQCKNKVRAWHNIPIAGYIFLKGKCADCKSAIGLRYPIIELITGILSAIVIWKYGATVEGLCGLGLTWSLVTLAVIDLDTKLLPDSITLPLLWAGLIINFSGTYTDFGSAFWGAIAGYMVLWTVFWAFKILTKKEGMGYGDFKLLAALGAWLGWYYLPMIILLSSVVGLIVAMGMIVFLSHDRRVPIAFGPYLAIAGWMVFVMGEKIAAWFPFLAVV